MRKTMVYLEDEQFLLLKRASSSSRKRMSASKGVFEILEIDRADLESALEIENKYQRAGFGFVDSTCFALCEKYRIHKVFTYDRKHFKIYKPGFSASLEILPS